jgi:Predicted signal transduction protein with a C-terminal ATPase domain
LDKSDVILYNKNKSVINLNASEVNFLRDLQFDQNSIPAIKTVDDTKMVISIVTSEYNNWKFISVIPLTQYEQKLDYLRSFMTAIIILSILIAIVLSFIISIRLYRPFQEIMSVLQKPRNPILPGIRENADEFRYIMNSIINTFNLILRMEEELEHRLQLLKNAQSIALQSQINPHFLYNTLETANWMAVELTGGENDVSFILSSLAELFKVEP